MCRSVSIEEGNSDPREDDKEIESTASESSESSADY